MEIWWHQQRTLQGPLPVVDRSRTTSSDLWPRSQHSDLGHVFERAESVLDQPADVRQASQRPPSPDQVTINLGAVASDDIAEMLRMPERERGEIEQRTVSPRSS
jgi:hypothetical protein